MSQSTQMISPFFLVGAGGFLVGLITYWLFSQIRGGGKSEQILRQKYEEAQKQYKDYRAQVNDHFSQTADAIDMLTQSYTNVCTHLSQSAKALMDKEALQAEIEKRQGKAVTLAYLTNDDIEEKSCLIQASSVVTPQESSHSHEEEEKINSLHEGRKIENSTPSATVAEKPDEITQDAKEKLNPEAINNNPVEALDPNPQKSSNNNQ